MPKSYTTASTYIIDIDESYPVANQDNSSQGFRDNFKNIKTSLSLIDTDAYELTSNIVSLSNTITDFKNNIIKKFVLQDSSFLVFDDTATLQTGDVIVNANNGNFQKFVVSSGTHWFSFINWPKKSHANTIILAVSTSTTAQTKINFDFDLSGEGVSVSNYGKTEFPLELKGKSPFLFKIINYGIDDVLHIKPLNDNNKFTKPIVLSKYTRSSLSTLSTMSNGSFVFLTEGFNTPVYSNNGNWYSMFNNQFVDVTGTGITPEGPQGPTGNVNESLSINMITTSTTSGATIIGQAIYNTDNNTTISRILYFTISGTNNYSATGNHPIRLENNWIHQISFPQVPVGEYTIKASVIGQNGVTLNASQSNISVIPLPQTPQYTNIDQVLSSTSPDDVGINQTYVGAIGDDSPTYVSSIVGQDEGYNGTEIVDISLVDGVLPPGMTVSNSPPVSQTQVRLIGTPTVLGVYLGSIEITFNKPIINTTPFIITKEISVVPFPAVGAILPCSQPKTLYQSQYSAYNYYNQLGQAIYQGPVFAHAFNTRLTSITLVSGTIPPGMFLVIQSLYNEFAQPIDKAGLVGTMNVNTIPGVYTITAEITADSAPTIQVTKTITVV